MADTVSRLTRLGRRIQAKGLASRTRLRDRRRFEKIPDELFDKPTERMREDRRRSPLPSDRTTQTPERYAFPGGPLVVSPYDSNAISVPFAACEPATAGRGRARAPAAAAAPRGMKNRILASLTGAILSRPRQARIGTDEIRRMITLVCGRVPITLTHVDAQRG